MKEGVQTTGKARKAINMVLSAVLLLCLKILLEQWLISIGVHNQGYYWLVKFTIAGATLDDTPAYILMFLMTGIFFFVSKRISRSVGVATLASIVFLLLTLIGLPWI